MNRKSLLTYKLTVAATLLAMLAGCSPPTTNLSLPIELPERFSASGRHALPDFWWTAFEDQQLNEQVEQALASNFSLESTWHRFHEAKALLKQSGSDLYPELDATAQGEIIRSETVDIEEISLGLAAEYEVDLWGRIRSSVEAERYRAQATLQDYRTAALSLSAEVASTWFTLIEAREQVALLDRQIAANEKVLALIKARFGGGFVRSVDILRQQQLLEATREQLHVEEARARLLEHLLSILTGQPPAANDTVIARNLPDLPPLPTTGIPLDLVRRRPDVLQAWLLLQAADRDVAAAVSNRYPRLTLNASTATIEDDTAELFDDWISVVGGNLLAPLIDGGRRRAEVDRTEAARNRFLSNYAQVTLEALRDVEDAIAREQTQLDRIDSIAEQVRLAGLSYDQLRNEFFNGIADYIDVLQALTDRQQLQRQLLTARRNLLDFRIGLYRSLAGGFTTPRESDTRITMSDAEIQTINNPSPRAPTVKEHE